MRDQLVQTNCSPWTLPSQVQTGPRKKIAEALSVDCEPLPRAEFDAIVEQVERWGLDDFMAEKAFDSLALPVHA